LKQENCQLFLEPIRTTLRNLFLSWNLITALPSSAFHTLTNLETLNLDGNNLGSNIPWNAFDGLNNLEYIALDECGITTLHPWIFQSLPRLSSISLSVNHIRRLSRNIFDIPTLSQVNLGMNEFTDINTNAFGRSLGNLRMLFFSYNQITSIDPNFIGNLTNADTLMLIGNRCTQGIFENIPNNINNINNQLSGCYNNFRDSEVISCVFISGEPDEPDEYSCLLTVNNPSGREFERLEGTHLQGRTDNDVNTVTAFSQNSPIIPEVLCRQFPNLIRIQFAFSGVEDLTPGAFVHCSNLQELSLTMNEVREIRDNVFASASNLRHFEIEFNGLVTIHPQSFAGSSLEVLDLAFNEIAEFNPAWFVPIGHSLSWISMMGNMFSSVPDNAFR
jgi:Leucine-rich repeat (LRR) protein